MWLKCGVTANSTQLVPEETVRLISSDKVTFARASCCTYTMKACLPRSQLPQLSRYFCGDASQFRIRSRQCRNNFDDPEWGSITSAVRIILRGLSNRLIHLDTAIRRTPHWPITLCVLIRPIASAFALGPSGPLSTQLFKHPIYTYISSRTSLSTLFPFIRG